MGFAEAGPLSKVACLVIPLGIILVIVGIATPNWVSVSGKIGGSKVSVNSGLWKTCANGQCVTYDAVEDYVKAVRAFLIISILSACGCLAANILSLVKDEAKIIRILAIVMAIASGLAAFIGVGVMGGKYLENVPEAVKEFVSLSWSTIITAVGGAAHVISFVLLVINHIKS